MNLKGNIKNIRSQRLLPEHHEDIIKYAHQRCPVNHPTVVYKKSKVLAADGYQGFPEDYILWINMIMNGCKFYNLQKFAMVSVFLRCLSKKRRLEICKKRYKSTMEFL